MSGAPIGEDLTVVSWLEGDNLQINTVASKEGIQFYGSENIIVNKHGGAITAIEQ